MGIHLFHQIEELEDLVVGRVTQGAEERRDGKFLFSIDVDVHHVADIGRELHPRSPERDDARGVDRKAVRMDRLVEKDAGRSVQLVDNHSLGPVDDIGAAVGHHRQVPKVHFLLDRIDVALSILALRREAQLRLQRHRKGQAPLLALYHRILRLFNIVLDEFENVVFPGVGNRKIHFKYLLETLVHSLLRRGRCLEEMLPGFELDIQQIRIIHDRGYLGEGDTSVRMMGMGFHVLDLIKLKQHTDNQL